MDKSDFQREAEQLLDKLDIIGNGSYHKVPWLVTEFENLVDKYTTSSNLPELEDVSEIRAEISRAQKSKNNKEEFYQRALNKLQSQLRRMIDEDGF